MIQQQFAIDPSTILTPNFEISMYAMKFLKITGFFLMFSNPFNVLIQKK
jgi:hypothetical protein